LSINKIYIFKPCLTIISKGFPICSIIFPFETLTANLLGVKSIDNRMVDMLKKLPVNSLFNGTHNIVCIDK